MVHRLQETSQIQIKDKLGPFQSSLAVKKPFINVRPLQTCKNLDKAVDQIVPSPHFLVYDRYRFEVVDLPLEHLSATKSKQRSSSRPRSRSLRRSNSLTATGEQLSTKEKTGLEALQALRKDGKVIHCTYNESSSSLCMLLADKTMAMFDFQTERLNTGYVAPGLVIDVTREAWTRLESNAGTLSNKFSKGNKLHQLVTQTEALDFNLYTLVSFSDRTNRAQVTDSSGEQLALVFESKSVGQVIVKGKSGMQIVQPGALATNFIVNKQQKLNVSTEIRVKRIKGKQRVAEISVRSFVFQLQSQDSVANKMPFLVKEERASIMLQLASKEECQALAQAIQAKQGLDKLLKAEIKTCPETFVSLLTIESVSSSHVLMLDLFKKQTVVDLTQRMHGDIPMLHKQTNRQVLDTQWITISRQPVVLMTLSDSSLICFDQDGQQVKLLSDAIYGQNIVGNFDYFNEMAKVKVSDKAIWALNDTCLTLFDGIKFQTFRIVFSPTPFQKPQKLPCDLRRCQRVGAGFPLLTISNEVVLDSKLFDKNERVFWHFYMACKLYQLESKFQTKKLDDVSSDLLEYRTIFQTFHTVLYFTKYQQYALALQVLICAKKYIFSSLPIRDEFWEAQESGKNFVKAEKTETIQMFKQNQVQTYKSQEVIDNKHDKSCLLKQIAAFLCIQVIQHMAQRQMAIQQKLHSQNGKLLPQQILYEQTTIVQSFVIMKRIIDNFFSSRRSLSLHYHVAKSLDAIQTETEKQEIAKGSIKKIQELRRIVLSREQSKHIFQRLALHEESRNFINCREPRFSSTQDPNLGKQILISLLQPGLNAKAQVSRFTLAVALFKQEGLNMPANEFLIALQLFRQVQLSLSAQFSGLVKNGKLMVKLRAMLPSALDLMNRIRGNEITDLADLKQQSKVLEIKRDEAAQFSAKSLTQSFDLLFADSQTLMLRALNQQTQTMDELLLLSVFHNEVKDPTVPTQGEFFKKLLSISIQQKHKASTTLVCLQHILDNSPQIIEPESNALNDIKNGLFSQIKNKTTTKYPKLLLFMLQNVNKMQQKEFKQVKLPAISLDSDKFELNQLLLNSLVALCTSFKCDFSINTNALLNAPTLKSGILEAMSLEEIISKTMLRTSRKIELQNSGIDETKEALWEIILWLWQIQCKFMIQVKQSNKLLKEQAKAWRVRSIAIQKVLTRDTKIDTFKFVHMLEQNLPHGSKTYPDGDSSEEGQHHSNDSYTKDDEYYQQCKQELDQVVQIYFNDHSEVLDPLVLVSRMLTDSDFSKFLLKIPTLFRHYNAKVQQLGVVQEMTSRVDKRIKDMYWDRYQTLYHLFGLKLNYSLKYERGINMVHLVKRRDRKSFRIETDMPQEVSIKQMEKDVFDNAVNKNDLSFVSDDLFNRSIKSQDSAFTVGHLQNQQQNQLLQRQKTTDNFRDQSSLQIFEGTKDMVNENQHGQNLGQIQDLSAIEHRNEQSSSIVTENDQTTVAINPIGSQKDLHQRSNLMADFQDMQLEQRESAPLLRPDGGKIKVQEVNLRDEPIVTNFELTDLNFLGKQGRVLSPLEPSVGVNNNQGDDSAMLDQSVVDHLQTLQHQISIMSKKERKTEQMKNIKKSLRLLEKIVWKKQTQAKFSTLYQMRVFVDAKTQAEKIAALKQVSAGSGSAKDDSTSMGQQTTTGALSTQLTVQDRGRGVRGRGLGRGQNVTDREELSPDFTATQKSSPINPQSHTQRMRGNLSPKFFHQGRSAGRGGSSYSRGETDDEHRPFDDINGHHQYKTITLREDDEFYRAYMNRGRSSPLGLRDPQSQNNRFKHLNTHEDDNLSSSFKHLDHDQATSRFDDSRFEQHSEFTMDDGPQTGWYERRNRFLDLHLHVQNMKGRVVRTPEMEASRFDTNKVNGHERRHSHSPIGIKLPSRPNGSRFHQKTKQSKKTKPSTSILDKLKLMRVVHPSQVGVSPMRHRADIMHFTRVSSTSQTQSRPSAYLNQPMQKQAANIANQGVTEKQRKARFLQFPVTIVKNHY